MPSPRRLRLLMLATLVVVVLALMYVSSLDDAAAAAAGDKHPIKDFYHKTMDGMGKAGRAPGQAILGAVGAAHGPLAADTKERLRAAEQMAKGKANGKALRPDPPSRLVGVGNSAEGQAKKPKHPAAAAHDDDAAATAELNRILKMAPVIIFSKSYCPWSTKAKDTLSKYTIKPPPHVVELDLRADGASLQKKLSAKTDRATVPNVLVNSVSMGGSDDIARLHKTRKLAATILELGGKRIELSDPFAAADPAKA